MDLEERQDSELADMAQDRPVAPATWFRPPVVRLDGERLTWSTFDPEARRGQQSMRSGPGLLEAFLALANRDFPPVRVPADIATRIASNERILAFARRWGVLGLCEHHLPSGHPTPPAPVTAPPGISYCMPAGWWDHPWNQPQQCWESLDVWRSYASKMRAARNIAAQLHLGRPGRPKDWQEVRSPRLGPPGRVGERVALAAELDRWLTIAGVRPLFMWTGHEPRVSLEGAGLVGALVVQLMLAVARTGLAVCTGCANAYVPRRRPRADVANYCPECQKKGAALEAAGARYRQARREARGLAKRGMRATEIAKRQGREVAMVRRWLTR